MSEDNLLHGIDKLRRIGVWADWQIEDNFDGKSFEQIINLYEKCQKQGVDVIEDLK